MLNFSSHKIQYYISIVLLPLVVIIAVLHYFDVVGFSHSADGAINTLEKAWNIPEGSLQKISGKILVGPYRDLRTQWYTFFGQPETFDFWLYNFTLEDAHRMLHERASNNTIVRGIIESNQFAQDGSQFINLVGEFADSDSIKIVSDDRLGVDYQHAKTFLSPTSFIIQTANMTNSSFRKNREVFFLSQDTGVLASLQHLFTNDRLGGKIPADQLHPNLVVCPINCRQHIEALLKSAQNSIIMYEQYIADKSIQNILREKREEGIDIQIILGDAKDNGKAREKFLQEFTGNIHFQANPYVHAKVILVDNQFLLVGSMNISDTSLDKNREIGILLTDAAQISTLKKMFMKDWNK